MVSSLRTTGLIAGLGPSDFVAMKDRIGELQRQLGSGERSQSYGGLGNDRGLAIDYRATRSRIEAFQQTVTMVSNRISVMDTALNGLQAASDKTRTALRPGDMTLISSLSTAQVTARNSLDMAVQALNSDDGGRYLFGGRRTGGEPVVDVGTMLRGRGALDGYQTVMRERMQADLGSNAASPERDPAATGRIALSAAGTQPVSLTEDGVHGFGLKIGSVTGAIGGIQASVSAGPPAALTLATAAGNAKAGEVLTVSFRMPDGSLEPVTLTAVQPGQELLERGQFRIGADASATLDAMRGALETQVRRLVTSALPAAAAVKAAEDFFTGETDPGVLAGSPGVEPGAPRRLAAGPSGGFADAVAYDGLAASEQRTVRWYQGDRSSSDPRATSSAQIDMSISVSYGARADEDGPRKTLAALAIASSMTFDLGDQTARERYNSMATRVQGALASDASQAAVTSIRVEIAAAQASAKATEARHRSQDALLSDMQAKVEGISNEEVAAQIMAMQLQLQASYQTTSLISRLSLVDYLR